MPCVEGSLPREMLLLVCALLRRQDFLVCGGCYSSLTANRQRGRWLQGVASMFLEDVCGNLSLALFSGILLLALLQECHLPEEVSSFLMTVSVSVSGDD